MADPFIIQQLRQLPLFARLSDPQLDQVAGITQMGQYAAGQYVFAQGQPTVGAQIFASGRGALLSTSAQGQQPTTIGTVEAGHIINEGALFDEGVETASLRILEASVVLLVPRTPLKSLMAQNPALHANLRVLDSEGSRDANRILFRGQRGNETVLREYHRHWWGFIRHAWIPFGLAVIFLIVSTLVDTQFPGLSAVMACLTIMVPLLATLFLIWEWRNDRFILSNQRLVFINMQAWRLTRSVSGVPIDRIGEVQVDIPPGDVFARMFNYGTLVVKTTADRGVLSLRFMPDPFSVQKVVFEHRERFKDVDTSEDENQVRAQVAQVIGIAPAGGTPQNSHSDQDKDKDAVYQTETAGPPFLRTRFTTPKGEVCYRHHWIKWLRMQILPLIVLAIALFVAGFNLSSLALLPGGLGLSLGFFVLLAGGIWGYLRDWDWRNDLMIIGDNTITFQYKRPLWLQNQLEKISLIQLDNVSSRVGGIVGNTLNVGDISLSLVGGNTEKRFNTVGDPESVQAEITWRTQRIKERVRETADDDQREAITQYLHAYHEMMTGQQGGPMPPNTAGQPTVPVAPAQPTQPLPYIAPTVPYTPAPTQPAAAWSTQPNAAPANLTFQAPGVAPSAPPASGSPKAAPPPQAPPAQSPPPQAPSSSTSSTRPPRVPRPRPSDLPD